MTQGLRPLPLVLLGGGGSNLWRVCLHTRLVTLLLTDPYLIFFRTIHMKGRKPTPIQILKLKGTVRKERHKEPLPINDPTMLPPAYLPPRAKAIFMELFRSLEIVGASNACHSDMLGLCALSLYEVETLTEKLKTELSYQVTNAAGDKLWKARPEQKQRAEAIKRAQSLLSEFGLSASSCGKITIKPKEKENNQWKQFQKRTKN